MVGRLGQRGCLSGKKISGKGGSMMRGLGGSGVKGNVIGAYVKDI